MVSQHTQVLFLQATATETWTQFTRTATIRSGCPATWTACPSRASNVTWRPSSMRLSWMEALWTLILTRRLPLMGFLSGWSPLHTAGCRARVRIRWDQTRLWNDANSINKNVHCMSGCWTIGVLLHRFLCLAAASIRLEAEMLRNEIIVILHTSCDKSQATVVCLSVSSLKGWNPWKYPGLQRSVKSLNEKKKTFRTPEENQKNGNFVKIPDFSFFLIVNWARTNHFLMLLKTQLAAAQMSLNLQLHWKHRKAASLSRGKVQWSTFLIGSQH